MPGPGAERYPRWSRRRLLGAGLVVAGSAVGPWPGRGHARWAVNAAGQSQAILRIWSNRPEQEGALRHILSGFTAEGGVAVELTTLPSQDFAVQTQSGIAAGEAPDVTGFLEGPGLREAVWAGSVVDLSGSVVVDELLPALREQVEFDGGVWAAPFSSYTTAVFYRRSVFDGLGIAVPARWDDLPAACQRLAEAGETPLMMPAGDGIAPYYAYILAASSLLGTDGWQGLRGGERRLSDPDLLPAAELLPALAPFLNADFAGGDFGDGASRFLAGEGAMMVGTSALLVPDGDDAIGVFPFPAPDGGVAGGRAATLTGVDILYAVNAASPLPDEAAALVAWLSGETAQRVVAEQIGLPVRRGMIDNPSPLAAAVGAARAAAVDLPVWYAVPELEHSFQAAADLMAPLLLGELPPPEFAAILDQAGASQAAA